jgi:hypothetical protein
MSKRQRTKRSPSRRLRLRRASADVYSPTNRLLISRAKNRRSIPHETDVARGHRFGGGSLQIINILPMAGQHLRINNNMFVVLRPGLPTTHLAKCIDGLMSIADHDPACPKRAWDCMDMTRAVAQQILAEVLESKEDI